MAVDDAIPCPICDADLSTPWGIEFQGHRIVRCEGCGLRYVSPRRDPETNLRIYGDPYFERARGREADPSGLALIRARDAASLAAVRAHCRATAPSLLDVGAGTGSFLKLARDSGAFSSIAGTDLSAANQAALGDEGITLHVGDIETLTLPRFDVITLHHVLEHVLDPPRFLAAVRRALEPDGIVHILVPNEGSFTSRIKSALSRSGVKKKPLKHLAPGHHLYFFEPRTLQRLLNRHGFAVVDLRTRADAKNRGRYQRCVHWLFDRARLNSWIEVVARRSDTTIKP